MVKWKGWSRYQLLTGWNREMKLKEKEWKRVGLGRKTEIPPNEKIEVSDGLVECSQHPLMGN